MELIKITAIAERFSCRPSDLIFPDRSDSLKLAIDNYLFDLISEYDAKQLEDIKRKYAN